MAVLVRKNNFIVSLEAFYNFSYGNIVASKNNKINLEIEKFLSGR